MSSDPSYDIAKAISVFEEEYKAAIMPLDTPDNQLVFECMYDAGAAVKHALDEFKKVIKPLLDD